MIVKFSLVNFNRQKAEKFFVYDCFIDVRKRFLNFGLGLFAPVERGITRYNILQSVRDIQNCLKSNGSPSSPSDNHRFTQFTTLQRCTAYSNSALRHIRPGTILEQSRFIAPCPSPSPSTSSTGRLRSILANLSFGLNRNGQQNYQSNRSIRKQTPPPDYLEVKSIKSDEHFCLKSESVGMFVGVYKELPGNQHSQRRSLIPSGPFSSSSQQCEGLYTVPLLTLLKDQYPLITELIISRTVEETVPTSVGYPLRRSTLHRCVERHKRIVAFDMKNYAFLELDTADSVKFHVLEHDDTLFQRYQAQLRWCNENVSSFLTQIKTIVHSSDGSAMFVQSTPLRGQQLGVYEQRRDSSSISASPLTKHIPQTIFTSQESISSLRSRIRTASSSSKVHSTVNGSKSDHLQQQQRKGKTSSSTVAVRKDIRVYFNDPSIQTRLQPPLSISNGKQPTIKRTSFHQNKFSYQTNSTESESADGDEDDLDESYQCTAL